MVAKECKDEGAEESGSRQVSSEEEQVQFPDYRRQGSNENVDHDS